MRTTFSNTVFIGKNVHYYPSCTSTNVLAQQLFSENHAIEGDLIITDFQTAGRGQRGNSWESDTQQNLTFSVVLQPSFLHPSEQFYLNIVVSLALHDVLRTYFPQGFAIKWPNDLYFENKKIAGILIENSLKNNQIQLAIVGIGLNINQANFQNPSAVSLLQICKQTIDREEVISFLLESLEKRYFQLKYKQLSLLRDDYLQNLFWFQEKHLFDDGEKFHGTIIGINEWGQLLIEKEGISVESDRETRKYNFKEIKFII